ncbi:MAG: ABC-2 transporter permease [Vicinamibacterales bacterium]|jgi:ABC-type transport system involved in multi-copper enzyme maturation permease subunit|nr:ABC-2 transporter permease [Vicinamibacterales bacterium]
MLRNALRKDLLLNARHLWGILPWFLWVAYAMSEPDAGRITAVGAAFIGALMATTMAAREDKLRTSATLASLPVSRRTLVEARYLVACIVGAATYLIVVVMAAALPWSVQRAAELVEPRTLLLTLTLASTAIALLMPVVIRYGLLGVMVFLGAFQVLGVAVMVAFEFFGLRSAVGIFRVVERSIAALHQGLNQPVVIVETAAVVALATWLSFRLSVFLAERRDL